MKLGTLVLATCASSAPLTRGASWDAAQIEALEVEGVESLVETRWHALREPEFSSKPSNHWALQNSVVADAADNTPIEDRAARTEAESIVSWLQLVSEVTKDKRPMSKDERQSVTALIDSLFE